MKISITNAAHEFYPGTHFLMFLWEDNKDYPKFCGIMKKRQVEDPTDDSMIQKYIDKALLNFDDFISKMDSNNGIYYELLLFNPVLKTQIIAVNVRYTKYMKLTKDETQLALNDIYNVIGYKSFKPNIFPGLSVHIDTNFGNRFTAMDQLKMSTCSILSSLDKFNKELIVYPDIVFHTQFDFIPYRRIVIKENTYVAKEELSLVEASYDTSSKLMNIEFEGKQPIVFKYDPTPSRPMLFNDDMDSIINIKLLRMQLAELRQKAHLTQKEVSNVSGLSVNTISELENPNGRDCTLNSLVRYLHTFGMTLSLDVQL